MPSKHYDDHPAGEDAPANPHLAPVHNGSSGQDRPLRSNEIIKVPLTELNLDLKSDAMRNLLISRLRLPRQTSNIRINNNNWEGDSEDEIRQINTIEALHKVTRLG